MKYAILDYGKDMVDTAHVILNQLQSEGAHMIIYLTDADGLLCLEYITEDEFLDHYKKTNNGKA
jgi:hypothetical protein